MVDMEFNYSFSKLGVVNVKLYELSSLCYKFLGSNNTFDHIKRLKKIDQVGVIRNVHEGTHHPRWEYVALQLNIINQLCSLEIARGLGLSSKSNYFRGFKPSGGEILQIWALLFNSGHLPGTFASERGFLKYLLENTSFRAAFSDGIKCYNGRLTKSKKKLFKQILENEDIYSVHKILITFFLNRYRRSNLENIETGKFIDFLQEVHDFYFSKQKDPKLEEKRIKLNVLFRRIRQLSYLFLDSQYAPIPISFELPLIFFNFEEYYDEIFINPESQIVKTLNSFDDLLSTSFYHSKYSISELGYHSKNIYKKLENENISSVSKINDFLINHDSFQIDNKYEKYFVFQIFFDISVDETLFLLFKKFLSFDEEKKWNDKFGRSYCTLTFQSSPSRKHYVVNVKFEDNENFEKNFKILGLLIKQMIDLYKNLEKNIPDKKELIKNIFKKPFEDLTIDILRYITKNKLYFEFDNKYCRYNVLPSKGSTNASKKILNYFPELKDYRNNKLKESNSNMHKSRIVELNALCGTLKEINHKGSIIFALNPIWVYDSNRRQITDFDGLALGFYKNELTILIVQAKKQKRRSIKDAHEQLSKNLDEISFITSKKLEIIESSNNYCAYLNVGIDGN